MTQPSPPNSDPRRSFSFSGLTVIVGLVLVIIAATALAVATYLALGPMSFRRQAITRAIEEDAQASRSANAAAADSASAGAAEATSPASPTPPETAANESEARPRETNDERPAGKPPAAEPSAERQADPASSSLTELTPIEVVGTGIHAGEWRGAVTCGARSFRQAIALRPAEDEGVVQIGFSLQARFARLRGVAATIGPPAGASAGASQHHPQVVFRIYGDGNLLWESDRLVGPGQCQEFQCDVGGVDVLTLNAESESPASLSNFAWGEPLLTPVHTEKKTPPQ